MKTLCIKKGITFETETGSQTIIGRHGSTSFIIHNFDSDGNYTGASVLTDREIIHKYHDMTRKLYDFVELID